MKLDTFTKAYIEAALGSETDDNNVPLDKNYELDDIAESSLELIIEDCRKFQENNQNLITDENYLRATQHEVEAMAGHDFWLTRNRHGAGFWDGDWDEPAASLLTEAAHAAGESNLYLGDDDRLYV